MSTFDLEEELIGSKSDQPELDTLCSEGIQIWGATQETLEKQALTELEAFVEENKAEDLQVDGPSELDLATKSPETIVYAAEDDNNDEEEELVESQSKTNCLKVIDDALEINFKKRLNDYYNSLEAERGALGVQTPKKDYSTLKGGLKVPKSVWSKLYDYQREGVYWLWELHQRNKGGLLSDEMGLGKTVQVIVFLRALHYNNLPSECGKFIGLGPTLIVSPATVINQWVQHFHRWAPECRVVVLHQSGTHRGSRFKLIRDTIKNKYVLVTTYAALLKYGSEISRFAWHYCILDEGHTVRNPSAKITGAVKAVLTRHRVLLTGSPMQNNLKELWSLFDFANPGMLGDLPVFEEHFVQPILRGGSFGASSVEEATASAVASALKNLIGPFLLRRTKSEVKDSVRLPPRTEQVLFCSLTREQREVYKQYLAGPMIRDIIMQNSDNLRKINILTGLMDLRKICNHPDFICPDEVERVDYKKSGKMIVVSALLKIWRKQGHRALLFSQGRAVIRAFQAFLDEENYKYLKMDGTTGISARQKLIDKFNSDDSYNVFLLTTRVGGLGVNLTGADRVIIYDPDWNPATDTQARERAWRIGQDRPVTIYRLLSAGTVEEKIYQRQVWKQLLSDKVLVDPGINKFFKTSDLFDLFSLPDDPETLPETTNIFRESRVKLQEKIAMRKKPDRDNKVEFSKEKTSKIEFSQEKIAEMKKLAQQIAQNIANNGQSVVKEKSKKKRKRPSSPVADTSGLIDGEPVEGLLKRERKKRPKSKENQDDFILEHLFSKKGVSGALEHDMVLNGSTKRHTLKVRESADETASKALRALKKTSKW